MSTPFLKAVGLNPVPRWEWLTVFGIVFISAILRFAFPDLLAVEHFDEGVYASNIWFGGWPGGVYPLQHLYGPPLLPTLIEWVFILFGPSNAGAMWPNQVAGTVTVVLLWWLGRTWFGPVAGLTAASLCAVNEVHLLLSRSALTDVLLGMWWLAALLALRRACDSGRWSHSLLAGVFIGLAWYTKYNGWMPLGITVAAVAARGLVCRGIWPQTRTALRSCLIAGLTAFVIWSPWLWTLQSKGGYASVMANHRLYVVGFSGWLTSLMRQCEQLAALTGSLSLLSVVSTFILLLLLASWRFGHLQHELRPGPNGSYDKRQAIAHVLRAVFVSLTFSFMVLAFVSPILAYALLTIQGLAIWLWIGSTHDSSAARVSHNADLGYWILLAWFCGMLLVTPFYSPYLRLDLPWLVATFLGVGLAFQGCWTSTSYAVPVADGIRLAGMLRKRVAGLLLFVFICWGSPVWSNRELPPQFPLADRSAFATVSRQLAEEITKQSVRGNNDHAPFAVYVYAEPGLIFQLQNARLMNVVPAGNLQFTAQQPSAPDVRLYLAVGLHAKADPKFREQFEQVRARLKLIRTWPWHVSPLVALDQPNCNPHELGHDPDELTSIDLYQVKRPD